METTTVTLEHGLKIGEAVYREVVLRAPTVGDMMDADDEAAKLTATPDGYKMIATPTAVGLQVLRRQIERAGDYDGAVTMGMIRAMHPDDLALLQDAADALSGATLEATASRGRPESAPQDL